MFCFFYAFNVRTFHTQGIIKIMQSEQVLLWMFQTEFAACKIIKFSVFLLSRENFFTTYLFQYSKQTLSFIIIIQYDAFIRIFASSWNVLVREFSYIRGKTLEAFLIRHSHFEKSWVWEFIIFFSLFSAQKTF